MGHASRRLRVPAFVVLLCLATTTTVAAAPTAHSATYDALFTSGMFEGVGDVGGLRFYDADVPDRLRWLPVRVSSDSDPVGIVVRAVKRNGYGDYFFAEFSFTEALSDQLRSRLRVSDGDQLRYTYVGATAPSEPAVWYARSVTPVTYQIIFENSDPDLPTVSGARRSVAPGALVRIYARGVSQPVATTLADDQGRFEVASSALAGHDQAWVTAEDNGYAESTSVAVLRAWVMGELRLPDDVPVDTALVGWNPADGEHPCAGRVDDCAPGGALSDNDGRWSLNFQHRQTDPDFGDGTFLVEASHQNVPDDGLWTGLGYGSPDVVEVFSGSRATTIDVGLLWFKAPHLTIEAVDAAGRPVDAHVAVHPVDGEMGNISWTHDELGTAGVHFGERRGPDFPPGEYQVSLAALAGCRPMYAFPFNVTWDGIRATPDHRVVVFRSRWDSTSAGADGVTAEVSAEAAAVDLPTALGDVAVAFASVSADARLSAWCAPEPPSTADLTLLDLPLTLQLDPTDGDGPVDFGGAEVCLPYEPGRVADAGATADDVVMAHVGDDGAVDTLPLSRLDLDDGVACARVSSFSSFAVAVRGEGPSTDGGEEVDDTTEAPGEPDDPSPTSEPTTVRDGTVACPVERTPRHEYTDVDEGSGHNAGISCVAWWGVVRGDEGDRFGPSVQLTRAEMAAWLDAMLTAVGHGVDGPTQDYFDDDEGSVYEPQINRLAARGVVQGRSARMYDPGGLVTRGHMSKYLVSAMAHLGYEADASPPDRFEDDNGGFYEPWINAIAHLGVAAGRTTTAYAPAGLVRRAEIATFVMRTLDLAVEGTGTERPDGSVP